MPESKPGEKDGRGGEKMKKILITVALVCFVAKLATNIKFLDDLNETFAAYDTELTPAGSPLLMSRAFFALTYSFAMMLYCICGTLHINGSSIIDSSFYGAFSSSCVMESLGIVLWAFEKTISSFILMCTSTLLQYPAMYQAYTSLYYAKANESELEASAIWCNRIFIQSALIFDCAWNTVFVILSLAVVLCYDIGLTSFQASVVSLLIFAVILIAWFLIENFAVEKYVRFAVVEYIAISVGLTSLFSRERASESYFSSLLLSMMAIVLILLFLRVILIVCFENKRKSQDRMYTMVSL